MTPVETNEGQAVMSGFRSRLLAPSITLILALSGCGDGAVDESTPATNNGFVGRVDGIDAFVSIVIADERVAAYVCNGEQEIAEYFWGPTGDPASLLLESKTGATMQADVATNAVSGTITLSGGAAYAFTAQVAEGDAGLYYLLADETVDADLSAGWVIDNDGNQRGAVIRRSRFEPTPSLGDTGVRIGATRFAVARIGVTNGIVTPNNIVAPNNFTVPNVVRVPNPPAPFVPIPLPNIGTASKSR